LASGEGVALDGRFAFGDELTPRPTRDSRWQNASSTPSIVT
jgi:hypothetical protein